MGRHALNFRVVGLTGGYCAGKNLAAEILERAGFRIIDVDKLGHQAVEGSTEALRAAFGPTILKADGSVDRRSLGALVFSDPQKLALHESIVHPAMLALLDLELRKQQEPGEIGICVNAALLYRFPQVNECALVIEITAPLEEKIARGMARDGLDREAVLARIARQRPLWRLRPKAAPQVVRISNDGDRAALERKLHRVLSRSRIARWPLERP